MASTIRSPVRGGKRGENAAAVEPAHAPSENGLPIEIAGLQHRARFICAIVKYHRRPNAEPAVAVDRRHVRTSDAVVFETLVERLNAHGADVLGNQVADGIVHHRARDAGGDAEAVRKIGGDVKFASAHMNFAFRGFAERDYARIQAIHQCAQRQQTESAFARNVQETQSSRYQTPGQVYCVVSSRSKISTRRFSARPAAVSFESFGSFDP